LDSSRLKVKTQIKSTKLDKIVKWYSQNFSDPMKFF